MSFKPFIKFSAFFAFTLAAALFAGCRGGEDGATINMGDYDTETSEASESSESENEAVSALVCPNPGVLPFTTEASSFADPISDDLAANYPFYNGSNLDVIGLPSAEQAINGMFARGSNGLLGTPFVGEWVSVWKPLAGLWKQLGRVQTDENGAYSIKVPDADKFAKGTNLLYGILEGSGDCAVHGVFLWPEGTTIIVTDIDGTMTKSDQEMMKQLSDANYDAVENKGALDMMKTWASKGYYIVYMTARPHTLREMTRKWLYAHDFPFGPVITAETMVYNEAARKYKGDWIKKMKNDFQWNVAAAYGNAQSDVDGYSDGGIAKDITFTINEASGSDGTTAIADSDFTSHTASYVKKQADVTQP